MAGIIIDIQPQSLLTRYTPLDSQFSIIVVGNGSTSQFYYTNGAQYIPNRVITPMKLSPSLFIVDPDGILGNGDKSSSLSVTWYENNVGTPISTGTDYTVNSDGSLLVKKNVPVSTPVQLICQATFTDTRTGKPLVFEDRVVLNSIAKADERVTVAIDKDVVIAYNPITDSNLIDIKATVYLGAKAAPAANCVFWWYKIENGTERLIGSNVLDIEYVSGQNTATLRVDANNVDSALYRCRAAYYTGAKPSAPTDTNVKAETTLMWKLPAPLRGDISSPMGKTIRSDMGNMTFTCRLFTNQNEITNVDKHFLVLWYKKSTAAGATAVQVGHGASITLPASELRTTGGLQMQVYPVVTEHGAYQVLTDKSGDYLTDKDGNILIGF